MKTNATIVVPTFNGEEFLGEVIEAVFNQKTAKTYELLIIDSGSSDGTLDIIAKYPKIRLHQIPNKEFGHGRTRNLAVEMADSEFVVFLTQDATPSHERWLDYLLEPFTINSKVGCVLGKQIPRAHCFVTLKREVAQVFKSFGDDGSISLQRKDDLTTQLGITNNFLSDTNSAVRKSIATKVPFQDVNYAEDQALGIDMLDRGYFKAYAPLGSVFHSHDYPLSKYFKRKFDEYMGLKESTGYVAQANRKELILGSLKSTMLDYAFLFRDREFTLAEKIHDFFLAPFYNFATRRAIRVAAKTQAGGKKHDKLSLESKTRKQVQR